MADFMLYIYSNTCADLCMNRIVKWLVEWPVCMLSYKNLERSPQPIYHFTFLPAMYMYCGDSTFWPQLSLFTFRHSDGCIVYHTVMWLKCKAFLWLQKMFSTFICVYWLFILTYIFFYKISCQIWPTFFFNCWAFIEMLAYLSCIKSVAKYKN